MAIGSIGSAGITPIEFPSFDKAAGLETKGNGAEGFNNKLTDALNNLNKTQGHADDLAMQVASGKLEDIHDFTIAATKAELATSLTVAVRNKAVDAFQQIMNMPV